jgi:hypothetical protein
MDVYTVVFVLGLLAGIYSTIWVIFRAKKKRK